jgi:uncharacterized protein (DUF885 family)
MKQICTILLALSLFACQNTPKMATDNTNLASLFERFYDDNARLFPLKATYDGEYRYNHLLPNSGTQAFRDSCAALYQHYLTGLSAFQRETLSTNDQISYDIFRREMEMSLEGLKYPSWQLPFSQFDGLHLSFGQLGSGDGAQPFKTVQDYDNWLARCAAFPAWADTAIANFKVGMATGWTIPRPCVEKMIPQCRDLAVMDVQKSLFYQPIAKMPADFSAADRDRLTAAYAQMVQQQVAPAYQRLADFLQQTYLPASRITHGVGAMPGGDAYYNWCVRSWITLDNRTADQIFNTGRAEVRRLLDEMDRVRESTGFKGNLTEFFTFLKEDPQFRPFTKAEEVLDSFQRIYKIIQPNVTKMFTLQPKSKFEIRRTEAFREASASAEYNQGTADGTRPGIFYVPIPDVKAFTTTSGMESLFLHEAIPGHHFQVMLQMENQALPRFRRYAWYGAYGEGWALYTESLGKELGLYSNPYQYMGALSDEIHRAIRLVVDVGIHLKGWSREEAIRYSLDNEPISEAGAIAEIERYMVNPAQALSYKTGSMHLRQLRENCQQQLGDKFSLADFHDEILRDGCLPLAVLDRKMERWLAQKKQPN